MKVALVAVVILALASVVALYAVASLDATPATTTSSSSLLNYETTTQFDYVAHLKPNLLYNSSTLGPGQGTLYESLVTSLDLSFTYWLNLSAPSNVAFGGGFELVVSSPGLWNYTLNFSVKNEPAETGITSYEFTDSTGLALPGLYDLVGNITNQTQVSQGSFSVRYTAIEVGNIDFNGTHVQSFTTPFLNFTFGSGLIVPGPLVATSFGDIPTTVTTTDAGRASNLELATILSIALLVALGAAIYWAWRPRAGQVDIQADLKSLTAPYQDAIATTWTAPQKENVVVLRDWEDIVHVADMLGKPILRYVFRRRDPPRFFYYVLDGPIQYIYLVPREGRPAEEDLNDLT